MLGASLALLAVLCAMAAMEAVIEARNLEALTRDQSFAELPSGRVRYLLSGPETAAPTVVLLNGFVASLEQWEVVRRTLVPHQRVLSYDRGGFGLTGPTDAHDARAQAGELHALLGALHIDGPVVLVGFSSSASMARVFVADHAQRVRGLLLIEPALPELEGQGPARHGPVRRYARTVLRADLSTLFGLARLTDTLRRRHEPPQDTGFEARTREVLLRFGAWWAATREWLAITRSYDQALAAGAPPVPTTVLTDDDWGPGDGKVLLDGLYTSFVNRSPRGRLIKFTADEHGALVQTPRGAAAISAAIAELGAPDH